MNDHVIRRLLKCRDSFEHFFYFVVCEFHKGDRFKYNFESLLRKDLGSSKHVSLNALYTRVHRLAYGYAFFKEFDTNIRATWSADFFQPAQFMAFTTPEIKNVFSGQAHVACVY